MAINTAGFQVRNMPQVSVANPSLVAFNPTAVTDGMAQAFDLAKRYEALKASKALQAELEATRQGRIASQNSLAGLDVARAGSEIGMMPSMEAAKRAVNEAQAMTAIPKANRDLAQYAAEMPTFASDAERLVSDNQYRMLGNKLRTNTLPEVVAAEGVRARASSAQDQNIIDLAPQELDTRKSTLAFNKTTADLSNIMAPMEAQLAAFKTGDAMAYAGQDSATNREAKGLSMDLMRSQIADNLAQANARGAGKQVDPVLTLGRFHTMQSQVTNEQARLLTTPVPNPNGEGKIPLAQYLSETRDPGTGEIATKASGFLWMGPRKNVNINDVAEGLILQLRSKDKQLQEINKATSSFFADNITAPNRPEVADAGKQAIPAEHQEAFDWAMDPANANSPKLPKVLKKLKENGLIQ